MANEISLFIPAFKKAPSEKITIDDFINGVKFGKWKKETEAIRNEPDKLERKKLKEKVAGVTISGIIHPTREEKNLIEHSGFICIDIDGYTDRDKLRDDPYTFALFASISNSGLAVLVKINKDKHKDSFRWLQQYYFQNYGVVVDPAPQNPASLRFISYDPDLFINEKSKVSRHVAKKTAQVLSLPMILPADKIGTMIKECVDRGINVAEDYVSYRDLGFSIAAGFGENGREYFHALSSVSPKYNSHHCDRQYNYCLRNPNGAITVGTFYWMLKNAGVDFPKNEKYENAILSAAIAKKSGRTKEGVVLSLTEIDGIPIEDAKKISDEVFSRKDITLTTLAADPEKLIESLVEWIRANHPMKRNLITRKIEENGVEVSNERLNTIYLRARSMFNSPTVTYELCERVIMSEFTPSFHPIKEYIEKNRHRNTTGNIDRIIESIKSPTSHYRDFVRKWMLSLPAAVDGDPVRLVLALAGKQNTGKSEWFRRLLPDKIKKYYGESKMEAGKDDEILMCEKLIIMDDEMSGKSRTDEKRFKELTSKNIFSLRAPYGRFNEDRKRLAVLCGTSNELDVINDPTGNTRILPVEVLSIDHEMYNGVDKDELFMEIVRAYEDGEKWSFDAKMSDALNEVSSTYESTPFERELILKFFVPADQAEGYGFAEDMTTTEIKDYIESRTKQQIRSIRRLGIELREVFGERKSIRRSGKNLCAYSVCRIQEGAAAPTERVEAADFPF